MASRIPQNRASFALDTLPGLVAGRWLNAPSVPSEATIDGIATDTREPLAGRAFIALRGERFDGHDYLSQAAAAGAKVLVVEQQPGVVLPTGVAVLQVPSTLRALGDLAAAHRRAWGGRLVAVAGSVGKTTTRAVVAAVLHAAGLKVHSPEGNLNNFVGVPMVLLALTDAHDCAVVEIGTNAPGEVARLTQVTVPDAALLTRVALEHTEGLGDLNAIELEEGALFAGLAPSALAVANADDARCLRQLIASPAERWATYGSGAARELPAVLVQSKPVHVQVQSCTMTPAGRSEVVLQRGDTAPVRVQSPLVGLPGALALAGAVVLAEQLLARTLPAQVIEVACTGIRGEPGRLCPLTLGARLLVLDDTYNSSPASVLSSARVALELNQQRGGRLLLILGEMRELGALSVAAHRDVGAELAELAPTRLIAFGGDAAWLAEGFSAALRTREAPGTTPECVFVTDAEAALAAALAAVEPGDTLLVKASRSLRAERIVRGLCTAFGEAVVGEAS
jgi:UDP-N-acetylmuramoyl-tripeptide--D-alanyl-D-alanine ligase